MWVFDYAPQGTKQHGIQALSKWLDDQEVACRRSSSSPPTPRGRIKLLTACTMAAEAFCWAHLGLGWALQLPRLLGLQSELGARSSWSLCCRSIPRIRGLGTACTQRWPDYIFQRASGNDGAMALWLNALHRRSRGHPTRSVAPCLVCLQDVVRCRQLQVTLLWSLQAQCTDATEGCSQVRLLTCCGKLCGSSGGCRRTP